MNDAAATPLQPPLAPPAGVAAASPSERHAPGGAGLVSASGFSSAGGLPGAARANPGAGIDYELFLDCVHCGLCTAACPTYVELGDENDGPRGRIYLMRAVTDGKLDVNNDVRRHLDLCLDCRACETACPSGVQYGKLIEPFRVALERQDDNSSKTNDWFHRWILFGLFPRKDRLAWALAPARWAQRWGLHALALRWGLWKLLPRRLGRLFTLLPPLPKPSPALPEFLPAKGARRARVALFTGCVGDAMFRHAHWATARVLQENGCDVLTPEGQACCGAIHFHAGASTPARRLADQNARAFDLADVDAIIVNVAGCGSMMKDYGHHWSHDPPPGEAAEDAPAADMARAADVAQAAEEAQAARAAFAAKTKDVHEFLAELGLRAPPGEIKLKATYHDACHLAHAQKVRDQPRRLLAQVPGLQLVDLPESELCCGAAGTYNLTQPEMADRLGRRKLKHILGTGAQAVITANAGCILQIAREAKLRGEKLKVLHPMEVLDASYRGDTV